MPKKQNNKNTKRSKKSRAANGAAAAAMSVGKAIAKSLLVAAGTKVGGALGGPVGAALGGTAAAKFSRIVGSGDYVAGDMPRTNSLFKNEPSSSASFAENVKTVRVRRREFVKNVFARPGGFHVDSVVAQPGLTEPFPYLSNLARCYTKYRFNGLVYEFVSNVSPYSTTSAMGSMVLAFDPNQGNDHPTNKVAMENLMGSVSARPDRNVVFGVECARAEQPFQYYFIRAGDTLNTATVAEDYGRFYIAQSSLPSTSYPEGSLLGELWVTYDVELLDPRLPYLESGVYSQTGLTGSVQFSNLTQLVNDNVNSSGILYDVGQDPGTGAIVLTNVPDGSIVVMEIVITSTQIVTLAYTKVGVVDYPIYTTYQSGLDITYSATRSSSTSGTSIMCYAFQVKGDHLGHDAPQIGLDFTGGVAAPVYLTLNMYTLGQGQSFRSNGS